ncbi:MAG: outer membrane beta-barrel protein [Ferruginibacter sp.]
MKKIMLSLLIALCSLSGFAQVKGNISGIVKDGGDLKVIASATVSLLKAKDSTLAKAAVADLDGKFIFENVKEGSYFVSVSAIGHLKAFSEKFVINEANTVKELGVLQLKESDKSLAAVTVVARKPFIERKADRTIINVDAGVTNAGSTAMELLEKSPGVSIDKDGKISLKGKQGVIITIDGKQTYMGAQDLANYLHAMPSSNLELIELMPNPSSKYDAAGNSGIINLKTKKIRQKGFNGSVNTTLGQAKYTRGSTTLNLNYRNGKFNVFSTLSASYRKRYEQLDIHREYYGASRKLNAIFDQTAVFIKERNNDNAKLGVDFYATKKTTLGMVFTGGITPGIQHNTNTSFLKDAMGNVTGILSSVGRDKENWKNAGLNLNFSHSFDSTGKTLTADIDVLKYKSIHDQQFTSDNFSPLWIKQSSEDLVSDLPAAINVYSAKADYVQPLKKGLKMEAGLKTSFVKTDNFAGYFNIIGGNAIVDNDKTNHFKYNENINAAYVNFSKDIKKWSLQTGLRLENTNYDGNQFGNPVKPDSSFRRSYTGLFPTMFAGYKLNAKNELGFSYGRRISRPDYEDLNPFIFFIDKYTYEAGNPFLKPMFANVFEFSHTYNKFLTTTLNYTHSKDMFNEYFEQAGYATIVKENNYGSIDEISLAVNAEIKPTKWWTLLPYAEYNYNKVNSTLNGFDLKTQGSGLSTNFTNQFKFKKGWGAELSGFYRTKMKQGQFEINAMKQINVGVSKQVLKGKGNLKLNASDIFSVYRQSGTVNIENTVAKFIQVNDSRNLSINFSYRFGKPLKTQTRKTGGAGQEQNRIKTN